MYKPITIQRNNFFGGISDDPRELDPTKFQMSKHFDIFTYPTKLVPYRSLEADTNDGSTSTGMKQYYVRDYAYATQSSKLYGLGQNGSGKTKIVYKSDATTGNWTLPSSSEGDGAVLNGCFLEYKDYLWGFQGTNQIWKWGTLSGSPSITNSASTVASTITSVANGIIAADGNAYIAYNNVIVRIAPGGTITDNAKSVPDTYKITSLCNYGSYMAIACSPKSTYNGQSKVFIWNLSSDLFAETIDWGEGELRVMDNVEGTLIGITDRYLNNSIGAGKGSMVIQGWSGGAPQVLKEINTLALTGKSIPLSKAVKNNRLFWSAKIMTNSAGTTYNEGVWSFGRKKTGYQFATSLDIVCESANTSGIEAFGVAGNYFFVTHSADGSISKTDDTSTFSYTSIYESQIENFGTTEQKKKWITGKITCTPLASGASLTLKYKKDEDTSFTTIGSYSTLNGISRAFINIESSGNEIPTFKEIVIRIESTGGAEVTSYQITAQPLEGNV